MRPFASAWRFHFFPFDLDLHRIKPTYNPKPGWLAEAIEYVVRYTPYWELCIADDASTNKVALTPDIIVHCFSRVILHGNMLAGGRVKYDIRPEFIDADAAHAFGVVPIFKEQIRKGGL